MASRFSIFLCKKLASGRENCDILVSKIAFRIVIYFNFMLDASCNWKSWMSVSGGNGRSTFFFTGHPNATRSILCVRRTVGPR